MSCTAILLQHENSMKKCQSILIINEQQGKKVEQELICLYKKNNQKQNDWSHFPPEKNPFFFLLYNSPPYNFNV